MISGSENLLPIRDCYSWARDYDRDNDGQISPTEFEELTIDYYRNWLDIFDCVQGSGETVTLTSSRTGNSRDVSLEEIVVFDYFSFNFATQHRLFCEIRQTNARSFFISDLRPFYRDYRSSLPLFMNGRTLDFVLRSFNTYCDLSELSDDDIINNVELPDSVINGLGFTIFPDYEELLAALIEDHPPILNFGEIHYILTYLGISTEQFLTDYLGLLSEAGYQDIVLEMVAYDIDPQEIDYYMLYEEVDENTPVLAHVLATNVDRGQGLLELLRGCREHGINIHGGGPEFEMMLAYTHQLEHEGERISLPMIKERIGVNMEQRIAALRDSGRLVLSYAGSGHNEVEMPDRYIQQNIQDACFGCYLPDALEIDLINPGLILELIRFQDPVSQSLFEEYAEAIIAGSAILVERGDSSYSVIMPRNNITRVAH